ncbi:MAG TPA: heme-binding protein [Burkholderiales bacterium]|nr:heme-binding protein [Burkholderiales bacterium]
MKRRTPIALLFVASLALGTCAHAQDATHSVRLLTLESATQAARAALESCRKSGFQVAVAVVDRSGVTQVVLRDRFAGPHTVDMAVDKAWTAVSFRTNTTALAEATLPGKPLSGIRERARVAAVGGGMMIEAAGALVGGIGVSGAPGGDLDERCARAGIGAIQQNLDF